MNSRRVVLIYIQVLLLALVTDYTGWTNSHISQVSALRSPKWKKLLCCCGNGGGCGGNDPDSGSGPEGNDNEGYESDGDGPIPPPPPMPPPPPPIPPPPPSPPPQPIPPSPPVMLPRAKLRRDGDPGGRPSILPQSENNPFGPPKGPPKGLPNGLFEFLDDDDTDSNGSGGNPSDEVFV